MRLRRDALIVTAVVVAAVALFFPTKALVLRAISPGYGCCERCGTPWNHCTEHVTFYRTEGRTRMGIFALCEKCWRQLGTPEKRWPYYDRLMKRAWATEKYGAVHSAVMAEPRVKEGR